MPHVSHMTLEYFDDSFRIVGPQLLSSRLVQMTCKYRRDKGCTRFIVGSDIIEATASNICQHDRRGLTCLGNSNVTVEQVEHILSALNAMWVLDTDVILEYADGSAVDEVIAPPVMQLNSREFSFAIRSCFIPPPTANDLRPITLEKAYMFYEEEAEATASDPAFAIFAPLHKLHITTHINFPYFWGKQAYSQTITPLDYMKSICWARSFFGTPFPHEKKWEELQTTYPGVIREQENHYRSIMLDFTPEKWITPLVVNTEPVRHKMLDFIGELGLLGSALHAGIYIYKPSHKFNRTCVSMLANRLGITES